MNEFDRRWARCAAEARQAAGGDEQAPVGFTTRVLAAWRRNAEESSAALWLGLSLRLLAGMTAALVVCARSSSGPRRRATVLYRMWKTK